MPPRKTPYKPMLWGKELSVDAIAIFYCADKVYLFEGRQLYKDEVIGVLAVSQNKDLPKSSSCNTMFDTFDDPNDEFTKVYQAMVERQRGNIGQVVDTAFTGYRRQYRGADTFAIMVNGM